MTQNCHHIASLGHNLVITTSLLCDQLIDLMDAQQDSWLSTQKIDVCFCVFSLFICKELVTLSFILCKPAATAFNTIKHEQKGWNYTDDILPAFYGMKTFQLKFTFHRSYFFEFNQ